MNDIITTAEERAALPPGCVVRSGAGSIACRFDVQLGVLFGDDCPFPWSALELPLTVLWHPDQPTEPVRVLPSREEIRALFHSTHSDTCTGWCETQTERALALLADQPTVEQVKAQVLRGFAEDFDQWATRWRSGGWGSNPADQQTIAFAVDALKEIHAAADRLTGDGSDA